MKQIFSALLLSVFMLFGISLYAPVSAQTIIRDTELENAVEAWSEPIILASNLSPKSINIIFVQDSAINAFVAGGSNVFIYTGLIEKAENPQELLGVIAHELGHISGGHLIRTREALRNASYEAMLGTILGVGAAILTGDSSAASAIGTAGQSTAQRRFLTHSRTHESSADQAGLAALKTAKIDPEGLVTFFEKLQDQDLLPQTQQVEYVRTHPLTRNRIEAIKTKAQQSPLYGQGMSTEKQEQFDRLRAKLIGFIQPTYVELTYSKKDTSIAAQYARAIAAYRQNQKSEALQLIDALLTKEPKNPYFLELKGQMLLEFGDVEASLSPYREAIAILPNAGLIRAAFAHALIEASGKSDKYLNEAIDQLNIAYKTEKNSLNVQRLLGTAYGRLGQEGKANIHLAEEALLKGQYEYAAQRINVALKNTKNGSPDWYKAQDMLNVIKLDKESN